MPWKLIITIFVLIVIVTLVGFNAEYTSNVSLIFYEFQNVRTILIIGVSFVAGALFAIPYTVSSSLKIRKKQAKKIGSNDDAKEKELVKKIEKSKKTRGRKKKGEGATPIPDVPPEQNDGNI